MPAVCRAWTTRCVRKRTRHDSQGGCTAAQTDIYNSDQTLSMTEINETDRVKRRSRTVDVNGLETTYEYAEGGRVTTMTNPDVSTRITTNYLDGRVKSITGTGVVPQYYTYGVNTDGSTWTRVDTADATYAGAEDISSATDLRYRMTTQDVAGRLIEEEAPAYGSGSVVTEYAYDEYSRLEAQSQTGRADTLYLYDASGDLFRSGLDISDDGQLTLASTDRITDSERIYSLESGAWFQLSTTKVYPTDNSATTVTVSEQKRRLSGFTGSQASQTHAYDVSGNETVRTVEIDRANKTVTRTTDVSGSTTDAVSVTINGYLKEQNSSTVAASTTYGYDGLGRRTSIQDPRHTNDTEIDYYTGTRQIFTQTDPDGNTTTFTYYENGTTGAGQVKSVTNALNKKSYYAYDLLGRQIQTWGETDYPQEYGYNAYGELASLKTWRDTTINFSTATWPNPTGGTEDETTWTYDEATGLLERKEYADTNGTDYTYDSANRLHVRTWARDLPGGTTGDRLDTTYGYDADTGELLTVDYEDPNTTDITYTYDRLGRQATVADATGTRSFDYDTGTLQIETETLDATFYDGLELTREYEDGTETNGLEGRTKGYTLFDGGQTSLSAATYGYNTAGRLKTVTDGTDTFTYAYETDSNLLASLEAPVHAVAYDYENNRDLMTKVDNQTPGGSSSVSTYGYTYDALGRRDDRTQSGNAINTSSTDDFGYNPRSEVESSSNSAETAAKWNPTYDYDQIGNRQSSTGVSPVSAYTTNELNQYAAIDSINPGHDLDGNLIDDGGAWSYQWNNENRLVEADNYGRVDENDLPDSNGETWISLTYDYQGRLVEKEVREYENSALSQNTERYVYDGWNRIGTFDYQSSGLTHTDQFLWGLDLSGTLQGAGGVGGLLKEGSNYPLYDANGNIMQKLDGTGAVVMNVDYDPFGNIIALKDANGNVSTTLEFVGEYGFSTKPLIGGILMYYYGFRYYDPVTGRWPSRDPLEEYAHNTFILIDALKGISQVFNSIEAELINTSNSLEAGITAEGIERWEELITEVDDLINYIGYQMGAYAHLELLYGTAGYRAVDNNFINYIDILGGTIEHDPNAGGAKLRDSETGKFRSRDDFRNQIKGDPSSQKKSTSPKLRLSKKAAEHLSKLLGSAANIPDPTDANAALTVLYGIECVEFAALEMKCFTEMCTDQSASLASACKAITKAKQKICGAAGKL